MDSYLEPLPIIAWSRLRIINMRYVHGKSLLAFFLWKFGNTQKIRIKCIKEHQNIESPSIEGFVGELIGAISYLTKLLFHTFGTGMWEGFEEQTSISPHEKRALEYYPLILIIIIIITIIIIIFFFIIIFIIFIFIFIFLLLIIIPLEDSIISSVIPLTF